MIFRYLRKTFRGPDLFNKLRQMRRVRISKVTVGLMRHRRIGQHLTPSRPTQKAETEEEDRRQKTEVRSQKSESELRTPNTELGIHHRGAESAKFGMGFRFGI